MEGYDKVERLFKLENGELVRVPPAEWDATFSGVHGEDLRLVSNRLREMAVKALRMAAYIDARGGEDGADLGHEAAVRAQNAQARLPAP
jgi:hypothetical protein